MSSLELFGLAVTQALGQATDLFRMALPPLLAEVHATGRLRAEKPPAKKSSR